MKATRVRRFFLTLMSVFLLAIACPIFGQSESGVLNLTSFLRSALEISNEIARGKEAADAATQRLEEIRLSGASGFDLEMASIEKAVAELRITNTRNDVLLAAVDVYFSVVESERDHAFSARTLELRQTAETLAERRYEEGVKTEEAYLAEVSARLSAELGLLQSEQALVTVNRRAERMIGREPAGNINLVEPEAPVVSTQPDEEALLEQTRSIHPGYVEAVRKLELHERRLESIRKLGDSVAPKELGDAENVVRSARTTFEGVEASIEDGAWNLISNYRIIEQTVENGRHQMSIAERNWESRKEKHEYGILSDNELEQYRLSYERERVSMKEKIENLLRHHLRIKAFAGSDVLAEIEKVLSR